MGPCRLCSQSFYYLTCPIAIAGEEPRGERYPHSKTVKLSPGRKPRLDRVSRGKSGLFLSRSCLSVSVRGWSPLLHTPAWGLSSSVLAATSTAPLVSSHFIKKTPKLFAYLPMRSSWGWATLMVLPFLSSVLSRASEPAGLSPARSTHSLLCPREPTAECFVPSWKRLPGKHS